MQVQHILLRAEDALSHITGCRSAIKDILLSYGVSEGQYQIQVGFNENLIQLNIGYLQEIYLTVDKKLPLASSEALGKIFSPFPAHVFTPSNTFDTPVFHPDGSNWDRTGLVHTRKVPLDASLSSITGGTSHMTNLFDSRSISLSGNGLASKTGNSEEGDGRGDGEDKSTPERSGSVQGDEPSDRSTSSTASKQVPCASFDLATKLSNKDGTDVQKLRVKGALICQACPAPEDDPNTYSTSYVEVQNLKFQAFHLGESFRYLQHHVRIAIDSRHRLTIAHINRPHCTAAADREWLEMTGGESTTTSAALGQKRYTSRISQFDARGVVWWNFHVDHPNPQENGLSFTSEMVPSVDFEFLAEGVRPPPPEFVNVEFASYWTLDNTKNVRQAIPYRNLCQIVRLDIPTSLSRSSNHVSVLAIDAGSPITNALPSGISVPGESSRHDRGGNASLIPVFLLKLLERFKM